MPPYAITSSSSVDICPKEVSVMPKCIASFLDVTGSSIRSSSSRIKTDERIQLKHETFVQPGPSKPFSGRFTIIKFF
ncbi:unnamed protein product [Acanthoscelides obtectus]|uniref:Uncharacterized protein n=1 Tax=Acanthoscelides obtectus TaxID=200917 RepID=A0A9P0LAT6_ACAOB|nr:unnamed protein product [Acanthoscelides obtectus]CAK1649842.1 hypothetical protein AOBTE_LOCUS16456 [Acanthoscelides obtectus]